MNINKLAVILLCLALSQITLPKSYKKINIVPASKSSIKNIIFDVGDVLVTTSGRTKALLFLPTGPSEIGTFFSLLSYNIEAELLKILKEMPTQTKEKAYNKNKAMPQIMVDWMSISHSTNQIRKQANSYIQQSKRPKTLKKILTKIINFMFDPQKFIEGQKLIKPMVFLVQMLKQAGYKTFILSNWDDDSFPLLKKRFFHFFNLFNGIMISGTEGMVKPNPLFYIRLLTKYQLQANQSLFIDDEPHNIKAAQKLGIHTILKTSDKAVFTGLKNLKIVSS